MLSAYYSRNMRFKITGEHPRVYRAAIIGCGRIGADCGPVGSGSSRIASHAASYSACDRTQLVAVCDLDLERLRRCGERWKVARLYRDPSELFAAEQIGLVSICTPPATHVKLLAEVLRSDRVKGVLLEKPLAVNLENADKAIDLAAHSTAKVAVNYIRRFPSVYRQAADDLQQGRLGRIQHVNILYTKGIVNNGSHALDLLRFLFGEPARVSLLSPAGEMTADPTLSVKVEFPAGFEAWLYGLSANAYNIFEVDILGSQGRMLFRDQGHVLDQFAVEDTLKKHGFRQLEPIPHSRSTNLAQAVRYAVVDLIQSMETGEPPGCTLQDARAALDLSLRVLHEAKLISSS